MSIEEAVVAALAHFYFLAHRSISWWGRAWIGCWYIAGSWRRCWTFLNTALLIWC